MTVAAGDGDLDEEDEALFELDTCGSKENAPENLSEAAGTYCHRTCSNALVANAISLLGIASKLHGL